MFYEDAGVEPGQVSFPSTLFYSLLNSWQWPGLWGAGSFCRCNDFMLISIIIRVSTSLPPPNSRHWESHFYFCTHLHNFCMTSFAVMTVCWKWWGVQPGWYKFTNRDGDTAWDGTGSEPLRIDSRGFVSPILRTISWCNPGAGNMRLHSFILNHDSLK